MKQVVTLCAELNSAQLDFLRRFVRENEIKFILMVEGVSQPQTTTPITGEIEEALAHESVPSEIKGILEGYL